MLAAAAARSAQQARQRLVELLAGSGAAGWRCGGTVGGRPVDVAFPAARVAVEVIGWAGGSDRGRLPAAFDQGWSLLRVGWAELTTDPAAVLDRVASALSANHEDGDLSHTDVARRRDRFRRRGPPAPPGSAPSR